MSSREMRSLLAGVERHVLTGWTTESESAVLALCVFGTLSVVSVVVLMVCISADAAGVFAISIGGLLVAVGFTKWICSRYSDVDDPDLEPPPPDVMVLHRTPQRGSSVIEFAFIYPLVFVCVGGLFGLGQAFYTYNSLQSAARSAARYASLAAYDLPNGTNWKQEVRNMAVYGDPDPAPGVQPLVAGLSVDQIDAAAEMPDGEPTIVTVSVSEFEMHFIFAGFTISQPIVKFPFLGRTLIP